MKGRNMLMLVMALTVMVAPILHSADVPPPGTPTIESPGDDVLVSFNPGFRTHWEKLEFPLYQGKEWVITTVGSDEHLIKFVVTKLNDGMATIVVTEDTYILNECTYRRRDKKATCSY